MKSDKNLYKKCRKIPIMLNSDDSNGYKVCVVGEEGVGKTALINRYITGSFLENYKPTVAASYIRAKEIVGDHSVALNLWDTAGQERYRAMMPLYLRNVDCVILVLDVLNISSMTYVQNWIDTEYCSFNPAPHLIVCINKSDQKLQYPLDNFECYLRQREIPFYYTSSMNGNNVAKVFVHAAQILDEKSKAAQRVMLQPQNRGCCS